LAKKRQRPTFRRPSLQRRRYWRAHEATLQEVWGGGLLSASLSPRSGKALQGKASVMAQPVFTKVSTELNFPKEEAEILRFWKERRIFEQTLSREGTAGTFVFFEGPPTANGLPHNGHVLTRVTKDLFPRYKTMRGYRVPRKAGWDTHGLPVEVEVEKELRIHGKAAIEAYGVEPFVKECIESVFRYTKE